MEMTFRNLFITGKPGVGKTHLAKNIMDKTISDFDGKEENEFSFNKGKDIYKLFNCSELMFLARKPTTGEDLYNICIKAKGLVLDDLGMGKRSDFVPDIVYLIIDKRLETNRPTIVTSNLSLKDIAELIDDRLSSRLASYEHIELEGDDRRIFK